MNMFKSNKATTVQEYLNNIPNERKKYILLLHEIIQKSAPKLKPYFATNMIGYGTFKYKNYKKQEVDWPVIALANQINYISIYICSLENAQYLAEKYKTELGKVSVGKSCIRIKKPEDINMSIFVKLIQKAAKNPGLQP